MLSAMSTSVRSGPFTLRYAARSDPGLVRGGNQDSVYAGPRLLAVADGMGGMAAGDLASNIVITSMSTLDEDVPGHAMIDALRGAVDSWLRASAARPVEVPASDWLRWEQDKHNKLLNELMEAA